MLDGGKIPKMATAQSWGTPYLQVFGSPPQVYIDELDKSKQRGDKVFGLTPKELRGTSYAKLIARITEDFSVFTNHHHIGLGEVKKYTYTTCTKTILVQVYTACNFLFADASLMMPKFDVDILVEFSDKPTGNLRGTFYQVGKTDDYLVDLRDEPGNQTLGYCYAKKIHNSKLISMKDLFVGTDLFW